MSINKNLVYSLLTVLVVLAIIHMIADGNHVELATVFIAVAFERLVGLDDKRKPNEDNN